MSHDWPRWGLDTSIPPHLTLSHHLWRGRPVFIPSTHGCYRSFLPVAPLSLVFTITFSTSPLPASFASMSLSLNDFLSSKRHKADTALTPPTSTSLHHLFPVRHALHRFLNNNDAARLLSLHRHLSLSLLNGFTFSTHMFTFPLSALGVELYMRSGVRIARMSLDQHFNGPLVDAATGRSLLPSSLEELLLGHQPPGRSLDRNRAIAIREVGESKEGDLSLANLVERGNRWETWLPSQCHSAFNQPLSPSSLPHGLRQLRFSVQYDQPIRRGVLPASVTSLHLGSSFNQWLSSGVLPSSLKYLSLSTEFNCPLRPHVIPPSVEYLDMGWTFNHPLQPHSLPPGLIWLSMGWYIDQPLPPGFLPSSLTHLRLSRRFNCPLEVGSIPEGIRYLDMNGSFDCFLGPGLLPSSLRHLQLSLKFRQPLVAGSLPHGLEALIFPFRYRHPLEAGLIPSTVLLLDLGTFYRDAILPEAVPPTGRWLRLPFECYAQAASMIPPATEVEWYGR